MPMNTNPPIDGEGGETGPGGGGNPDCLPEEYYDAAQGKCVPRPGGNESPVTDPVDPPPTDNQPPFMCDDGSAPKFVMGQWFCQNTGSVDPRQCGGDPNLTWDDASQSCIPLGSETVLPPAPGDCDPYYERWDDQSQTCVPIDTTGPGQCNKNQTYDPGSDTCIDNGGSNCPDVYQPVECPNGQTYTNDCEARKAGQQNCQRTGEDNSGGGTVDDGVEICGQGQYWDGQQCVNGTTAPPNVNLGPGDPGYVEPLPPVDPYAVSQSPEFGSETGIGGVDSVNPQAEAFDYDSVNNFADAAWENSMRYIEPQMELQDDRFAQELINKGIDPNSEAGQKAFRQKAMSQNDMLSKSAFDALGYGSNLQNQMFGQDATRSQLANALLQSQWGLTQRGHEFDTTAGMNANQQAFGQMMGLEGLNYRDYLTGVDQGRYQDSLALALAGLSPAPTYGTVNTGLPEAPIYEYQGNSSLYNGLYG